MLLAIVEMIAIGNDLHLAGAARAGLERFGEVTQREGPVVQLSVDRLQIADVLAAILEQHTVVDMSVQDPPLDQVIARVFEEGNAQHEANHQPVG